MAMFGANEGWNAAQHIRTLADINGDGRDDLVVFANDGVWTALSSGNFFGPKKRVLEQLGYNQGWRLEKHVRILADVNNDNRKDIIAFGTASVFLALANTDGTFGLLTPVLNELAFNQGWDPKLHTRTAGDVNGDGQADIVAFGPDGVWTALSTGTGFEAPRLVLAQYGLNAGGWNAGLHLRMVKDIDNDGRADGIIAVDPTLCVCGGNSPNNSFCQRTFIGNIQGDRDGTIAPVTAN